MRIASLGLLLILSCTATAQTVWKYVDEKGVTHYTDQPVPGAERIQLRSGSSVKSPASAPTTTTVSQNQAQYRVFAVVKPGDQESVVNTGGLLQVSMQLSPAIMMGHSLTLFLDGKQIEAATPNALDYQIPDVPRGEHTLLGVIRDANGDRVVETNKVTFTMRQKSIAVQPPVGPSVRPQPKPPVPPRPPVQSSQPSFAELHPNQPVNPPANRGK